MLDIGRFRVGVLYLSQLMAAAAGGVLGGFSGFVANSWHRRQESLRLRKNVACALVGEISALTLQIRERYSLSPEGDEGSPASDGLRPNHRIRAGHVYMPVFYGLGGNIGILPAPYPRDLVLWYSTLGLCLEGEQHLRELSTNQNPSSAETMAVLTEAQRLDFRKLVESAAPLLEGLAKL